MGRQEEPEASLLRMGLNLGWVGPIFSEGKHDTFIHHFYLSPHGLALPCFLSRLFMLVWVIWVPFYLCKSLKRQYLVRFTLSTTSTGTELSLWPILAEEKNQGSEGMTLPKVPSCCVYFGITEEASTSVWARGRNFPVREAKYFSILLISNQFFLWGQARGNAVEYCVPLASHYQDFFCPIVSCVVIFFTEAANFPWLKLGLFHFCHFKPFWWVFIYSLLPLIFPLLWV